MSKVDKRTNEATHEELRKSAMMAHLLDALEAGIDIGQYGRLTFVMVARHFLEVDEMVELLVNQPEMDEKAALKLILQVQERDYNPPKREKVLEWQSQQEFQICPTPEDPIGCNVYRDFEFPQQVYDHCL